jgi:hypothetical protein
MIEKKFFIVERIKYEHSSDTYSIHDNSMYDLTTAVRKLLALDTLNENKKTSYHLQEVSFSEVQEPLILTKDMEVKEDKQSEMPF